MIKRLQKDNFKDEKLEQVQSNTEALWNDLRNHPLLKGRLIEGVEFTAANFFTVKLEHKLNRIPKGYIVVRNSSINVVHDIKVDKKFIYLLTDAGATVSLWVF